MSNQKFRSTQGTTLGYDSTQSTLETHRAKIASLESTIETLRTEHRAQITKLESKLAAITTQSDATAAAEASRVDALEARRIEAGVAISAQFAAIIARLEYSELQHQISKDRDALAEKRDTLTGVQIRRLDIKSAAPGLRSEVLPYKTAAIGSTRTGRVWADRSDKQNSPEPSIPLVKKRKLEQPEGDD